jgi:phosphoribosylformylglycinamidine cyclo-ligase
MAKSPELKIQKWGNSLAVRIPSSIAKRAGFRAGQPVRVSMQDSSVLVSSTDGVGTKLKVAFMTGKHDTVGIDLVAMCVNDIVVQGAEPLFFLDYFATGKLSLGVSTKVLKGIARGCQLAGCALIGGETAELPGFYREGEYDLAGFSVGVMEGKKVIDGSAVKAGDQLIGLASSGLHSNGYSLARKVFFERMKLKPGSRIPGLKRTLGEELLVPTRIYVKSILDLLEDFSINGIAHITGGGFTDNLPRVFPPGCKAVIQKGTWTIPPVFRVLQEMGKIEEKEMYRTFNNGIGMVLVVPAKGLDRILDRLLALKEKPYWIGEIARARKNENPVQIQ